MSDGLPCEAKERETLAAQLNDTYKMVQSYNLDLEVDNITELPNQALSMKSHQREWNSFLLHIIKLLHK